MAQKYGFMPWLAVPKGAVQVDFSQLCLCVYLTICINIGGVLVRTMMSKNGTYNVNPSLIIGSQVFVKVLVFFPLTPNGSGNTCKTAYGEIVSIRVIDR